MNSIEKKLTMPEWAKLKECETTIKAGQQTFVEVGKALLAIRDGKLYREKYSTFEFYCETKWQWGRNYANKLIAGVQAVSSLPKALGTIVPNEAAARAVAAVPAEHRAEVVTAAAATGSVTAKTVEKAAADIQEAEVIVTDANGRTVPAGIVDAWQKATTEGNRLTKMLHEVKLAVQRGVNDDDPTFTRCHNSDVADFDRVYYKIKNDVTPHVVCTTCQGVHAKKCKHCYGTGWLTMFQWKNLAEDIRKLAEKTGRKAAQ
jgi:hypothetical protein